MVRGSGTTSLTFQCKCTITQPGDRLGVVGSHDALGSWDTRKAVVLTTDGDSFPVWNSTEVLLPAAGRIHYKYVVSGARNGTVLWEPFDGNHDVQSLPKGCFSILDEFGVLPRFVLLRPSSAPLPSSSPSPDTLHASVHQLPTSIIRRLFTLLDGRSMCRLCRCGSWVRDAHMEPLVAATESHGLVGVVRFDKWLVGRQLRAALSVVEVGHGPGNGWWWMKRVLVLVGQCRSCELPVTVSIDAASNHPHAPSNDDAFIWLLWVVAQSIRKAPRQQQIPAAAPRAVPMASKPLASPSISTVSSTVDGSPVNAHVAHRHEGSNRGVARCVMRAVLRYMPRTGAFLVLTCPAIDAVVW
ncbi:unnamed protein product [Vitrella brassicaformis CCMP3155]|uniref:CBM20 domain-containing protein n=3 Tax=Vitrella brassicaformis TaxID=1169539 RepID=A0A0G4FDA8_VITBC|nr:unnamed protein product [Vitrella brassicaformis CCMP3155]|eukprot:CEM11162.1 unnamed protein product [Vitrella brassicaformis CCMP3155]